MKQGRNALLSVYQKDGITEFAQELIKLGINIYASGGTANHLKAAGVAVSDVKDLVGGGAILGHRVVTLSREVHAALLARHIPEDEAEMTALGIPFFDLVCVDLYPLQTEIARTGSTLDSVITQTDIGGPTMLRSGAKGQRIVICDPADRQKVIKWLTAGEPDRETFIEALCAKAEFVIAQYCMASAIYRSHGLYTGTCGTRIATCKYGENAWQTPAFLYSTGTDDPLALDKFAVIEGTPPSYNNWIDIDRLLQTMTHIFNVYKENDGAGINIAVGVKHGNPCGAAAGYNRAEILSRMMAGDPRAIFGGLIMTNFPIDETICEALEGKLLDGIIAPAFTSGAIAALRRKTDKCRFIVNLALDHSLSDKMDLDRRPRVRYVRGGLLVQPNYTYILNLNDDRLRVYGAATIGQVEDIKLAWAIGGTSNSNTITLVKDGQLIGNGVGQQDRVGAAKLAIDKARAAGHVINGAVAYSDSFFPFPDGPQTLIDAGVKAILTSSGSLKDQATIDVCRNNNVVLFMIPDAVGRGFSCH